MKDERLSSNEGRIQTLDAACTLAVSATMLSQH